MAIRIISAAAGAAILILAALGFFCLCGNGKSLERII